MKYFFPDSSDLVDPSFDFTRETRSATRVRQRDDLYAHEIFETPPFDGLLVSKAIVDGSGGGAGRYTIAQRQRLLRQGVRRFLRLDELEQTRELKTMGDCGAFSYVREEEPPFSVQSVIDFYAECSFDYGLAVDHVILNFDESFDQGLPGVNSPPPAWSKRQSLTLSLASDFWSAHQSQRHEFVPIGVAQGWSPKSYAHAVSELQRIGYRYIAIGGVVPLKTHEVLSVLRAVDGVRRDDVKLHLLGVTRISEVLTFGEHGVASFDSTLPLRQAFKDETDNYYTLDGAFPAIRIPQIQGNPKLQRRIASGEVDQAAARVLERACLDTVRGYAEHKCSLDEVLDPLCDYEELCNGQSTRRKAYQNVLELRPWEQCECSVCKALGIHVILFRGAERNRRRGFHNIYVFHRRLHRELRR